MTPYHRRPGAVLVVALALAIQVACANDKTATTTTAAPRGAEVPAASTTTTPIDVPDRVEIQAGINDPDDATIAVLEFLPQTVTIPVGSSLTWRWDHAIEPHSVTFVAPGEPRPNAEEDPSLFGPTPPAGPYEGTTFVNSGLLPLGPGVPGPFEMTFATEGSFEYHCVIHPNMTGTVTVVPSGDPALDTPRSAAERAAAEQAEWLAEGRQAKAAWAATAPNRTEHADGSADYEVEMGTTTDHTDILAFHPSPTSVRAGDTVTFVNNSKAPHTASFFGAGAEPITSAVDPRTNAPAPGPSPQDLSPDGFVNTGLLPADAPPANPPRATRSFTVRVPQAGSYAYICILHSASAMTGSIVAT